MKHILITGGTGSLGKYLTSHFLTDPENHVTVFSRDEDKQYHMARDLAGKQVSFVIGDIRGRDSITQAVKGMDEVINAAAMKQIPICEHNVWEAVKTNIIGTKNVVDACIEHNVSTAIMVSTDKAVNPLNLYGMTKAVAERLFIDAWARTGRKFICVRYGNVLGSRGSVVPMFQQLIRDKKPLTVTDRRMTRFILPLSAARDLITTAVDMGNGGEIFIPKIKTINIYDLAQLMIEDSGIDEEINIIGIRPGEKLHEILISEDECNRVNPVNDRIIVIMPEQKRHLCPAVKDPIPFSSGTADPFSREEMINLLKKEGWF